MKLSVSRSCVPILVAVALSSLPTTPAFAAGKGKSAAGKKDPLAALVDLNKKAVADLQAGRFEAARDTLLDAMVAAKDANLADHDMMARTHVHLGATYFLGFKDRNRAIQQFERALKINPKISVTQQINTPALQETFDAAKIQAAGGTPPEPSKSASAAPAESLVVAGGGKKATRSSAAVSEDEPEPPAKVADELFCPLPDEIPPEQDLVIRCVTKKQPKKSTGTVYYRAPGSEAFVSAHMTRSSRGWLMATVPGSAISGSAFQFYIEAHVPGVSAPVANGSSDNPSLLPIVEGAAPMGMDGLAQLVRRRSEGAGDAKGGQVQEEDILARFKEQKQQEEEQRLYHRRPAGAWFVSVGGGMGSVLHGSMKLDSHAHNFDDTNQKLTIGSGSSVAKLFQVTPEIGYQATDSLAISLQVRYQHTPYDGLGWNPDPSKGEKTPPSSALAILARVQYAFLTAGNFQLFGSGVAGGGPRGFLGYVPANCSSEKGNCEGAQIPHSDTLTSGPVLVGAGAGILYHLSRNIGFYIEGREIVSFPKVMALSEFNAGLSFGYKFEKSEAAPVMTEGGWERPPESSDSSDDPAPTE